MTIKQTTVLLTLATLTAVSLAEEKKDFPARAPQGPGGNEEMRQKMMLKRFDKDGDGKLNEAEKEAAANAKKEALAKYDKDGNGELSQEERKAFMDDRRKAMGVGGQDGRRGPAAMDPEMHKKILEKFDKDGDGKLNDEERKAAMEEHRKNMVGRNGPDGKELNMKKDMIQPEHRQQMIEKFDADGDGKLNPEERQKLQEHLKTQAAK